MLHLLQCVIRSRPTADWSIKIIFLFGERLYFPSTPSRTVLFTQYPHKHELHHKCVKSQELRSSVLLRPRDCVSHSASCWIGRVWEQNVFQRSELFHISYESSKRGIRMITRKKAFAKNVYMNTIHPAQPPVP